MTIFTIVQLNGKDVVTFLNGWFIGLVVLKFERCEQRNDTSIVDGDQEGVTF